MKGENKVTSYHTMQEKAGFSFPRKGIHKITALLFAQHDDRETEAAANSLINTVGNPNIKAFKTIVVRPDLP